MFWLRKLVSPSGVLLVLICLFLPFVGVACEAGAGRISVEVSGWDMVVGGEPSVSATGVFSDPAEVDDEISQTTGDDGVDVQPLMIVFVLTLLAAAALGFTLRSAAARGMAGLVSTGFAVLILIAAEVVMMEDITDEIAGSAGPARLDATELVGTRFGFWLVLLLLAGLLAYHVTELVLSRRRVAPPTGWPHPPGHYPGYPPQQYAGQPHQFDTPPQQFGDQAQPAPQPDQPQQQPQQRPDST